MNICKAMYSLVGTLGDMYDLSPLYTKQNLKGFQKCGNAVYVTELLYLSPLCR